MRQKNYFLTFGRFSGNFNRYDPEPVILVNFLETENFFENTFSLRKCSVSGVNFFNLQSVWSVVGNCKNSGKSLKALFAKIIKLCWKNGHFRIFQNTRICWEQFALAKTSSKNLKKILVSQITSFSFDFYSVDFEDS